MGNVLKKGEPARVDPGIRKRNIMAIRSARRITRTVKIKPVKV